jgi:anion-transporting  ArsA/GET3 family ATPase
MLTTELVLVSGKGGTGKSAIASAIAIERARRGQTVLAMDLGNGLGLGAHLRARRLTYQPVEIRAGLHAMTMERTAALDEYIKKQLHMPQGAPTKAITGALGVLVDAAPGVREIISIGKPIYELWQEKWDAVIVDTPSLGQFRSYLRAPITIAELAPTGAVGRQASSLADVLSDPETTRVVLVTNPAELPTLETKEMLSYIKEEALCPEPTVVMNRMLPPASFNDVDVSGLPEGPLRAAAAHQLSMERSQAEWAAKIDADATLPFLRGVLTPGEVAVQLADAIGAVV